MSVSKRLRYEVLRRDNYTCRYCGASAPYVLLEVEHVVPRKHGGRDVMENLVAACEACNDGKAVMLPEQWLVEETARAAEQWRTGESDEDDYADMFAYQDALYYLETMPAGRVIHWIAGVFIAAKPYRPTHSELIIAAAAMARSAGAEAGVASLCPCRGSGSTRRSR